MIAQTPRDVLEHVAALKRHPTQTPRERRISELEARVKELAHSYPVTDSPDELAEAIREVRSELRTLPSASPIDPTLILEDIVTTLNSRNIPPEKFGL